MILWYAAGAIVVVWSVFQSAGVDYRAIALGALVPLADVVAGEQAAAHSLVAPTMLLTIVMVATAGRGRRLLRRRIIGVPIGWYVGVALSGSFADRAVFWWPFGGDFDGKSIWPPLGIAAVLEAFGAIALRWIWVRFGWSDPRVRAQFIRDGRLDVTR